nr:VWA domain-containing protein [Bacilli bacterium]
VFLNRTQTVEASIRSFKEQNDAIVYLWKGDAVIDQQDFPINRGLNTVEFVLPTNEVGTFDYKITVEAKDGKTLDDVYAENNTRSFTQEVTDQFKVLILKGDQNTNVRNIFINDLNCFTQNTDVTEYWYKDNSLQLDLDTLLKYDEYILYDVSVKNIPHYDTFVANLFTCVASYGKTLQNFGELNLSNEDTDALSLFSDMLPVQIEGSSEKAVVLNIDVSGSMYGQSMDQAKAGAKACVDILGDKDLLGVVSFSDDAKVVAPLSSAKRNSDSIKAAIDRMDVEGGTEMNTGLKKSFDMLSNSGFEYKYVITLSDGEPFETERELVEQVEKMAASGIACSFINILNPSGEQLLQTLANAGYGAYFYCDNTDQLVDTMIEAVGARSLSGMIDNKDLPVGVVEREDPMMANVNPDALGSINGSYICYRKPDATTVLTIPYQKEAENGSGSANITLPLFAYWKFGKGVVSSFTSNLGTWTYTFRRSAEGKQFFQNVWNNLLPETASHDQIQFSYETRGVTSDIHIYAADTDTNADVKVTLIGPKGETAESQLFFDGKQYSGNIPTANIGTYSLHINYKHHITMTNGETMMVPLGEGDYHLFFDYSSEYNVFDASEGELLYQLASTRDQVSINEPNYAAMSEELTNQSYRSTSLWFLIATLVLFLADVFVRKGEAKKKKKPEYTVGTNLG